MASEVPEPVLAILGAMVRQVLARCDQLNIAWDDFYQALLVEQKLHPRSSVSDLFEHTFRRLQEAAN